MGDTKPQTEQKSDEALISAPAPIVLGARRTWLLSRPRRTCSPCSSMPGSRRHGSITRSEK